MENFGSAKLKLCDLWACVPFFVDYYIDSVWHFLCCFALDTEVSVFFSVFSITGTFSIQFFLVYIFCRYIVGIHLLTFSYIERESA